MRRGQRKSENGPDTDAGEIWTTTDRNIRGKNKADLKYEISSNDARAESVTRVDMKLEVVVIPVADFDRAKKFYGKLGWRLVATYPRTFERRSQCNRQL